MFAESALQCGQERRGSSSARGEGVDASVNRPKLKKTIPNIIYRIVRIYVNYVKTEDIYLSTQQFSKPKLMNERRDRSKYAYMQKIQ